MGHSVHVLEPGRAAAERFVADHLLDLCLEDEVVSSPTIRGGQAAADAALAAFDVAGYARRRNEAYPQARRGASGLSPYIRHGLLTLPTVWEAVDGPYRDVAKFRDELLWQEYARHWYARLGPATASSLRHTLPVVDGDVEPWDPDMACLELTVDELEEDGWLVNQTRMWLASHWTVRQGLDWRDGEDYFFRHLLDGSRAANRLGWQWTTGAGSNRAYGFSRWQVEKRAPGLCADCEVGHHCPIDQWPDEPDRERAPANASVAAGEPNGPTEVVADAEPEVVWLTAESLGCDDPALAANPDLPAVFVFDRPLLANLRLSSKRLVFLAETLAEIDRPMEIHVDDPVSVLAGRSLATTYAPVPGWQRRADRLTVVELHPWPWLRPPVRGSVASFSAWAKQVGRG
jgi:deoxyribodipyrimidine photo-lyase